MSWERGSFESFAPPPASCCAAHLLPLLPHISIAAAALMQVVGGGRLRYSSPYRFTSLSPATVGKRRRIQQHANLMMRCVRAHAWLAADGRVQQQRRAADRARQSPGRPGWRRRRRWSGAATVPEAETQHLPKGQRGQSIRVLDTTYSKGSGNASWHVSRKAQSSLNRLRY